MQWPQVASGLTKVFPQKSLRTAETRYFTSRYPFRCSTVSQPDLCTSRQPAGWAWPKKWLDKMGRAGSEFQRAGPKKVRLYTRWRAPASVAQLAETQCAPTGTVCQRSRGSIPGSAGRFRVRISGTHALRLISRAGKEGSTVSSIICDRWLILS